MVLSWLWMLLATQTRKDDNLFAMVHALNIAKFSYFYMKRSTDLGFIHKSLCRMYIWFPVHTCFNRFSPDPLVFLDFLNKSVSKHFKEASLRFDAFALWDLAGFPPNVIINWLIVCCCLLICFYSWLCVDYPVHAQFHFHAYLISQLYICYFNQKSQKVISQKLNQMSQVFKNIFSNKYFEFFA